MAITLYLETLEDAHEHAICNIDAFRGDDLRKILFGQTNEAAQIEFQKGGFEKRFRKPNVQMIKAVDDSTGAMVGFSAWSEPEDPTANKEQADPKNVDNLPNGMDRALVEKAEAKTAEVKKGILGNKNDLLRTLLCRCQCDRGH